jgi:hypothetical protein
VPTRMYHEVFHALVRARSALRSHECERGTQECVRHVRCRRLHSSYCLAAVGASFFASGPMTLSTSASWLFTCSESMAFGA